MDSAVTPELFDGQVVLTGVVLEAAAHFTLVTLALQQAGLIFFHILRVYGQTRVAPL